MLEGEPTGPASSESSRHDPLYTVAEVANILSLNPQTVRNWIDAGDLPHVRLRPVGKGIRIAKSSIEGLLGADLAGSDVVADLRTQILTVEDVARMLKLDPQTVRNWIDAGTLKACRAGSRRVRVMLSAVEEIMLPVRPTAPRAAEAEAAMSAAGFWSGTYLPEPLVAS